MNDDTNWFGADGAAKFIDVHPDTIWRRGVPFKASPNAPVPGKIRFRKLKLGENTRMERRYYRPDLEALLVDGLRSHQKLDRRPIPTGESLHGTNRTRIVEGSPDCQIYPFAHFSKKGKADLYYPIGASCGSNSKKCVTAYNAGNRHPLEAECSRRK